MSQGVPLTDQDRWGWLVSLCSAAIFTLFSPYTPAGVVLTCSALRKCYRDVIRIVQDNYPNLLVHFVYLRASEELLLQRVSARKGHYMDAGMVRSQLASLEEPTQEETDVISVDASGTKTEVVAEALRRMRDIMKMENL